jgi:DNA adenine methylase
MLTEAELQEIQVSYSEEENADSPLFEKIDGYKPRPFVKWAGGKRSLLREIISRFPDKFNNYYEPFIGGGAVFFAVYKHIRQAFLSDTNLDLIITYRIIQTQPEALIKRLQIHAKQHSKEYYYQIRSQHFIEDSIERAARFIYLNKTCYNGLYRVNKAGHFNTPMGSYKNPAIVDEENLLACHQALQGVHLKSWDFNRIDPPPQAGDLVYFDPPYHPTSDISFTSYTSLNFTEQDQLRLVKIAKQLYKRGVYVILSNSKTAFIEEAYQHKCFKRESVKAPRYVNCKPGERGAIEELLITTVNI